MGSTCLYLVRHGEQRPGREHTVPEHYRWFLPGVPPEERDPGGERLDRAYEALTAMGNGDRHELLVTHDFVIGCSSGGSWTRRTGGGLASTRRTAG